MNYECKRCKYESDDISNLYRHLKRKKECKVLFENISREELINNLKKYNKSIKDDNGNIIYKCNYCNKNFKNRSCKSTHQIKCKAKIYIEKIDLLTLRNKELEEKEIKRELEFNKLKDKLNKLQMIINE